MENNKPTNYLDAWRAGARFTIRKLSEKPQNFLTEGFREIVLMHAAHAAIKQRDSIRKLAELADEQPSLSEGFKAYARKFSAITEGVEVTNEFLSQGFKEGSEFVFETIREYDIAFLTDLTMADSIHCATVEVNEEANNLFP
jgi:hypothetical protein